MHLGKTIGTTTAALLSMAACSQGSGAPAPMSDAPRTTLVRFEGSFDAAAKTLTIVTRDPSTGRVRPQLTLPYGGTASAGASSGDVVFHTCSTSYVSAGVGGTSVGEVQAVNAMATPVLDLTVAIDSISDTGTTFSTDIVAGDYGVVSNDNDHGCAVHVSTWSFTQVTTTNFTFTGHATGTPATLGAHQTLVFSDSAAGGGVDQRSDVTAGFDSDALFVGYDDNLDPEHRSIGAATNTSAGHDAFAAWGAWRGGPSDGVASGAASHESFDSSTGGYHYLVGVASPSLPGSGVADYSLIGASTPSQASAIGPGTLDAATATYDFGTGQGTVNVSVTTSNGVTPLIIPVSAAAGSEIFGSLSNGSAVVGYFLGPSQERLMIAYDIGSGASAINGTALLGAP